MLVPDWFDRSQLRTPSTRGQLDKLMRVDGIAVSSWLARRERQGRPVGARWRADKLIATKLLWRPLDVLAAARADNVPITPLSEVALQLTLGELVTEVNRLIGVRDELLKDIQSMEVMHRLSAIPTLQSGKRRRLVSRAEILAVAEPASRTAPCGVYFLLQGDDLVYVGQSTDVHSRVRNHEKEYDRVAWVEVDIPYLDIVESLYIHALSPRLNKAVPLSIEELFEATRSPGKSKTRAMETSC